MVASPRFVPLSNFDLWEIAMELELSLTLRENGVELMPPTKWAGGMESNPSAQTLGLSLAQAITLLTNLQTEIGP
jgi:hypothetical protein